MKKSWFRLACAAAKNSDHERLKVGAVIVDKRPISVGCNKLKTHPIYANGDDWYSIHAEMSALMNAGQDVTGCSIYVYRETAQGHLAMARPCDACLNALIDAGIKTIHYTTPTGYAKEIINVR